MSWRQRILSKDSMMIIVLPLGSRTRIASRWSGNSATTEATVETDRKTARPPDRIRTAPSLFVRQHP
jgi:hypothetical protein